MTFLKESTFMHVKKLKAISHVRPASIHGEKRIMKQIEEEERKTPMLESNL
jgi:hypothetical protein